MQSGTTRGWVSGLDVLQAEQTAWRYFSSGCASIDQILGGGIRSHEITEFCTFLVPYPILELGMRTYRSVQHAWTSTGGW